MRIVVTCCLSICLGTSSAFGSPEIGSTTQPSEHGPDTVVLRELVDRYKPVPFDHKTHAEMAEMWDGCVTCHHREPEPAPGTTATPGVDPRDQNHSSKIPDCKSCHEAEPQPDKIDMHMPSLKGAYHRQCLNCHRDWANENSCSKCHEPVNGHVDPDPTPDDIVGRMHPPIPEPDVKIYIARFTPAVGDSAIFRHKEHSTTYGLKCVNCHRHDSCASCHSAGPQATGPRPVRPGRTWEESHKPCVSCHQQDRCRTCHYDSSSEAPPAPFEHAITGQLFDKDHANLKCGQCHHVLKARKQVSCGDASCHKEPDLFTFPEKRPGPVVKKESIAEAPTSRPAIEVIDQPTGTIKRVRRAAP